MLGKGESKPPPRSIDGRPVSCDLHIEREELPVRVILRGVGRRADRMQHFQSSAVMLGARGYMARRCVQMAKARPHVLPPDVRAERAAHL